jgi:hypothetical protein
MTKILPNYITEEYYIKRPTYIIINKQNILDTSNINKCSNINTNKTWGEYIYNIFFKIYYKYNLIYI